MTCLKTSGKTKSATVPPTREQILNGKFDSVTLEQTVDRSVERIQAGKRDYICTVNVAILMMMRSQKRLRQFINQATLIVADGQPIVWASRWLKTPLPERVTGIDLIESLAERAQAEGIGIYLLGSTPMLIETAARRLKMRYPDLAVDYRDGYFSLDAADDVVEQINQSKAKILLVGMGVPRQEVFLQDNWSALAVNLAMGVGGSFDVISGFRKRAPIWVQQLGLEWFYRFLQEPTRLGKRYIVTNTKFLYELSKLLVARALKGIWLTLKPEKRNPLIR